jgi:hypothetical protein
VKHNTKIISKPTPLMQENSLKVFLEEALKQRPVDENQGRQHNW